VQNEIAVLAIAPVAGVLALIFAYIKSAWVMKQDEGTDDMKKIAGQIQEGAMAFLSSEYKLLSVFVVVVAVLLGASSFASPDQHPLIALSFVVGAFASGLAGFFGMRVATAANVRTTAAARNNLTDALKVSFSGGTVMGMVVVGLALLGLGSLFIVYKQVVFAPAESAERSPRLVFCSKRSAS